MRGLALASLALVVGCSTGTVPPASGTSQPAESRTTSPDAGTTPTSGPTRGPVTSEDAAWSEIRARLPSDTPIARPTWLPADVDRDRVEVRDLSAAASDPRFTVIYTSPRGTIAFALGPAVDVAGSGIGTFVRNSSAVLSFPSDLFARPGAVAQRRVRWTERGRTLHIDTQTYTGNDLLHIAWSLDRTGAPPPPFPYARIKVGACAIEGGTAEDTVRGYIRLLSSGDADAIADCTALERLGQSAGRIQPVLPPTSDVLILNRGEVGGRPQLGVSWMFASDPGGAWNRQQSMFFTLGLEDGRWRIFETGTAAYGPPP